LIGVGLTVPIACWRKAHARELLETELVPPPATCFGALLSLVGEVDRERHRGCRVTGGIVGVPEHSVVVRMLWRTKDVNGAQGTGENAKPDFQQLLTGCDSREEENERLEDRVQRVLRDPKSIDRFGGWSLGESTHLINDAHLLADGVPPPGTRGFLLDAGGALTLPVWVNHVGMAGTRYVVGSLQALDAAPRFDQLPRISD
jgi:CRISPR-associated protein Cas5t